MWPVLHDPTSPGTAWSRQPLVRPYPPYCYTSGPSLPVIAVDNPPSGTGFSSTPITGTVTFDYVPQQQFQVNVNSVDFQLTPNAGCNPGTPVFNDAVGCEVAFTITPNEGQTYELEALTYNSGAVGVPVMDETTRVHRVPMPTITTGTCGAPGEACCDGNECDGSGECQSGTCVACDPLAKPVNISPGVEAVSPQFAVSVLDPVPGCQARVRWDPVGGATGYDFEASVYFVDKQAGTIQLAFNIGEGLTTPFVDLDASISGGGNDCPIYVLYQYRVRASGACGQKSDWSKILYLAL